MPKDLLLSTNGHTPTKPDRGHKGTTLKDGARPADTEQSKPQGRAGRVVDGVRERSRHEQKQSEEELLGSLFHAASRKTHPCDLAKQTCEGDLGMPPQSLYHARMAEGRSH